MQRAGYHGGNPYVLQVIFPPVKVVSVKVDEETKARMEALGDVNWSEVVRRSLRARIEAEEILRQDIDRRRATKALATIDRIRASMSGRWKGAEEIRKWRDLRR